MQVALGSTNPVKRRAVERVVAGTVEPVSVDSGVPEQPRSTAETIAGAETRATRALETGAGTVGIGLEGGVSRDGPRPGTWLVMWAAVTDGSRLEYGCGPSLRLPGTVERSLEEGHTLGEAMASVTGRTDVGTIEGAIGVLTDGNVDRTDALAAATACAFVPFQEP